MTSFPEFLSHKPGRGAAQNRRSSRKLQVAHFMAKPVTALLFVENIADSKSVDVGSTSGLFVWWWTKGGCMHVHDVQSNNTSKVIPLNLGSSRSTVRVLSRDLSQVWVWAGHDDGCASRHVSRPCTEVTPIAHRVCASSVKDIAGCHVIAL
jgi:hypothetical protein